MYVFTLNFHANISNPIKLDMNSFKFQVSKVDIKWYIFKSNRHFCSQMVEV